MNILSQRDPRWSGIKIGDTDLTLGGYGCTLTCIAMMAGINPDDVMRRLKAVGGLQGALVIWTKIHEAMPWMDFVWRGTSYDNDKVKQAISDNGACLVEVDFDGIIATPNDRHWVLYVGNQLCNDPWVGQQVATSKYPIQKGYAVVKKLADAPQGEGMPNMYKGYDLTNVDSMKVAVDVLVRVQAGEFVDKTKYDADLKQKSDVIDNLNQQINDRNNDIVQLQAQISSLTSQLLSATTRADSLEEQAKKVPTLVEENQHLTDERTKWQESEKTYNKTIAALKAENDKLRENALKALLTHLWDQIQIIINKLKGGAK